MPKYKPPSVELTDRESEIAMLIQQGKSTAAIASTLGISPNTVARHRAKIREKAELKLSMERGKPSVA